MIKSIFNAFAVVVFLLFYAQSSLASEGSAQIQSESISELRAKYLLPQDSELFPTYDVIKPNVEFWIDVYTKYTEREIVVHDKLDPSIIYKVINLDDLGRQVGRKFPSYYSGRRYAIREAKKVAKIIKAVALRSGVANTETEKAITEKLLGMTPAGMLEASKRIRIQLGLANRFREGLITSGKYSDYIESVLKEYGLPLELSVLPHVESSFNLKAKSHVGAAGIWQFTRYTGKLFLKVNHIVDERIDPIDSTIAAAKLLRKNYEELGSWPLAITAYNHGLQGIKRAQSLYGNNLADIIQRHKSRKFRFASSNFYSEFLAALHVIKHKEEYFGMVELASPVDIKRIILPKRLSVAAISKHGDIDKETLVSLNPDLKRGVVKGYLSIPANYYINVPSEMANALVASLGSSSVKDIKPVKEGYIYHMVSRGETLSDIASMYNTRISILADANDISMRRGGRVAMIYPGQKLRVPVFSSSSSKGSRVKSANQSISSLSKENRNGNYEYTVKKGDSLYSIARSNDITVNELARINDISNKRAPIYPGQRLILSEGVTSGEL